MGPGARSIRAVAEQAGVQQATLRNVSSRYEWSARAQAWDQQINERVADQSGDEITDARAELHRRATRLTMTAITKAQQIIDGIEAADGPTSGEISLIKAVITAYSRLAAPDETSTQIVPEPELRTARLAQLLARHQQHD